jgi:predicted transcriptional regulator YdeE
MLINYLSESEELTGYKVSVMRREGFTLVGYTLIVQPDDEKAIPAFWREVTTDDRLERLLQCSLSPTWCLGLSSWDPECPKRGQRYTIGIEATADTDFSALAEDYPLFSKEIGASAWLCFELPSADALDQLWKDDPYRMLKVLGYRFNGDGFGLGPHVDAYPPDYDAETNPAIEFWITVKT